MKKNFFIVLLAILATAVKAQCPITITASPTSICSGQSTNLFGSGATTYTWSSNAGQVNSNAVTVTPLTTTNYTLYGNTGACLDSMMITVNVVPPPSLIVTASSNNICSGQICTLTVSGASSYTWSTSQNSNYIWVAPISNTTYTVEGANGSCSSAAIISVNVVPTPTVSYGLTQNMTPHVWDAYPTYSGGTPPYTYSWNWGDGSPNSTFAYPSHNYTSAAWYNICATLTDANGCISTYCRYDSLFKSSSSSTMVTINVINGVTGINHYTNNLNRVSIYPNPTSDQFFIDSNTSDKINVDLFDVNGRHVFSQSVSDNAIINTTNLNEGVYTLTIKTADSVVNKKLVILR